MIPKTSFKIVVVVLLGAVGWLVYDRQKNKTDNNLNSPGTTSNTSNPGTPENSSNTEPKNEHVTIKEWGVKVSQPEGETIVASDPLGADAITANAPPLEL